MRVLMVGMPQYPLFGALAQRLVQSPVVSQLGVISMQGPLQGGLLGLVDHTPPALGGPAGLRGLRKLGAVRERLAEVRGAYDVVSVHYLHPQLGLLAGALRRASPRLVLSFWGSDLYRTGRAGRLLQGRLCRQADAITVLHGQMADEVGARFGAGARARVHQVRFGLAPLEHLREARAATAAERVSIGLPAEGRLVAVGYNAAPGQRHARVLASLAQAGLPEDVTVVLPLGYGGSQAYREGVRAAAAGSGLRTCVLDGYLGAEAVAVLRRAADVLVQVQPTDALSGSMQEHLYAGTVCVTGAWLKYDALDALGVPLVRVPSVEASGEAVRGVLAALPARRAGQLAAREALWGYSSWEANLGRWLAVLGGDASEMEA